MIAVVFGSLSSRFGDCDPSPHLFVWYIFRGFFSMFFLRLNAAGLPICDVSPIGRQGHPPI